jgi:hypothetical protein
MDGIEELVKFEEDILSDGKEKISLIIFAYILRLGAKGQSPKIVGQVGVWKVSVSAS